jgi:hypothetical protein
MEFDPAVTAQQVFAQVRASHELGEMPAAAVAPRNGSQAARGAEGCAGSGVMRMPVSVA